jgi:hypothetical protein
MPTGTFDEIFFYSMATKMSRKDPDPELIGLLDPDP